jgi:hypothetical protein
MKDACKSYNDNNDIDKISISVPSTKGENLDLKLIDLPGLDDEAKAVYINDFIDSKKEILNPIFVISLTGGGSINAN